MEWRTFSLSFSRSTKSISDGGVTSYTGCFGRLRQPAEHEQSLALFQPDCTRFRDIEMLGEDTQLERPKPTDFSEYLSLRNYEYWISSFFMLV